LREGLSNEPLAGWLPGSVARECHVIVVAGDPLFVFIVVVERDLEAMPGHWCPGPEAKSQTHLGDGDQRFAGRRWGPVGLVVVEQHGTLPGVDFVGDDFKV
jgi:hypothetical protein